MKISRGCPRIFKKQGKNYLKVVTIQNGEETTDFFTFDELKEILRLNTKGEENGSNNIN